MWAYASPEGMFWIKRNCWGGFSLLLDDRALGSYRSPEDAAADVYLRATGFPAWDDRTILDRPSSLNGWTYRS